MSRVVVLVVVLLLLWGMLLRSQLMLSHLETIQCLFVYVYVYRFHYE